MVSMGFKQNLIALIMKCVSSTSFLVLINRVLEDHIVPNRGLRQGDRLSPYLFFLYTKRLVNFLQNFICEHQDGGIKVCRGAPIVNHLLFRVIFCKVDVATSRKDHQLL